MRIFDIIDRKKNGNTLTDEEIRFFVQSVVDGTASNEQIGAMLMAIVLRGMDEWETEVLTMAMAESGDRIDLSSIDGIKVDKHSTGGVGDKTTLILVPLVASLGVPVAKFSGRGLGLTGGTIDKLASIPDMHTNLSEDQFISQIQQIGCAIATTGKNLDPCDKKLYAIRDVTATVDCIPLIASSIMSKKIASGSDAVVLDVKCGRGAFMKDLKGAKKLAELCVKIGKKAGLRMSAVISDMNEPLGNAVGNSLEVCEALDLLRGKGPKDLKTLTMCLASHMVLLAGKAENTKDAEQMLQASLDDGRALRKFREMIRHQGAKDITEDPDLLPKARFRGVVTSEHDGYVSGLDAARIGHAANVLGAGRLKKEDSIDYSAGVYLYKKAGDYVKKGDELLCLYSKSKDAIMDAEDDIRKAYTFSDTKPETGNIILEEKF